jgi:hypothetical protein
VFFPCLEGSFRHEICRNLKLKCLRPYCHNCRESPFDVHSKYLYINIGMDYAVKAAQSGLSLDLNKAILGLGASFTGCSGIVNLDKMQSSSIHDSIRFARHGTLMCKVRLDLSAAVITSSHNPLVL